MTQSPPLCSRLQTKELIGDFIFKLRSSLTAMKCTTQLRSEVSPHSFQFSQYEVEEFIADRIIFLGDVESKCDLLHTIQVVKMRGINHGRTKYVLNMDSKYGIELAPLLKANI